MTDSFPRFGPLVRLLKTLRMLERPNGATSKEIVEALEISYPTVSRTLRAIEELGFPVTDYEREDGTIAHKILGDSKSLRAPLALTASELISLQFIRGYERLFAGTTIEEDIDNVFEKISALVPARTAAGMREAERLFLPALKFAIDYSGKEMSEVIDDLTEGIIGRRRCRGRYHSYRSDKEKELLFGPLVFVEHDGALYIFALMLDGAGKDKVLMLAVNRFRSVEVVEGTFNPPKDFDPQRVLASRFTVFEGPRVRVRIWFSKDQARYIQERVWGEGQVITSNSDGSIHLELTTTMETDLTRWVRGYGDDAKIEEQTPA